MKSISNAFGDVLSHIANRIPMLVNKIIALLRPVNAPSAIPSNLYITPCLNMLDMQFTHLAKRQCLLYYRVMKILLIATEITGKARATIRKKLLLNLNVLLR